MKNGNEQLEKLLRQFMDDDHVRNWKEDVAAADALFEKYPARSPEQQTIDDIKKRVHHAIKHRRRWNAAKWCTAVAAVVAAALLPGLLRLPTGSTPNQGAAPVAITGQDELWTDSLYALSVETDPIEREMAELLEFIQSDNLSGIYGPVNTINLDSQKIEEVESLAETATFRKG